MNEPHDMGTAGWQVISQTALTAIRDNGDNKLIMIPGDGWSGAESWEDNNGPNGWIGAAAAMIAAAATASRAGRCPPVVVAPSPSAERPALAVAARR